MVLQDEALLGNMQKSTVPGISLDKFTSVGFLISFLSNAELNGLNV